SAPVGKGEARVPAKRDPAPGRESPRRGPCSNPPRHPQAHPYPAPGVGSPGGGRGSVLHQMDPPALRKDRLPPGAPGRGQGKPDGLPEAVLRVPSLSSSGEVFSQDGQKGWSEDPGPFLWCFLHRPVERTSRTETAGEFARGSERMDGAPRYLR